MKRFCSIGVGIIAAICLFTTSVRADNTVKKTRPYDKVSAVDATAKTITILSGPKQDSKDYKADAFTTIIINGKPGKLADIQTDMKADFSVRADGTTLTRIEADDPPVEKDKKTK